MKNFTTVALLFIIMAFAGCSSSDDNNPTPAPTPTPTPSPYFIEGKVDGVMYRAQYTCGYTGCAQATGNYSPFMERLTMQRTMSASNPIGWDIMITQLLLDSWVLPDTLDASDYFSDEHLNLSFYTGNWESDNNYLMDGVVLGDNSFQMIVTSKTGDVIEGTFSGELRNGSDSNLTKTVTNGKFKIKIIRL